MYLCRMTTSETIIKIGLEFGNRDHSTVLHSYDKINNEIQNDENNIRQVIEDIKTKLLIKKFAQTIHIKFSHNCGEKKTY